MSESKIYTPHIERDVWVREGTSDRQVWADVFTGRYHLPPDTMPAPGTVLDLGANIGLTAAHYRYLWREAKIVAVEMDAGNAELARRNAPGVVVRHAAVSPEPGQGWYDANAEAFAYQLVPESYPDRRLPVECVTLRGLIEQEFAGPVDFVKMDVEGAEWEILAAPDWAPLVRDLVVELHGEPPMAWAFELLKQAGFSARSLPPHPAAIHAWH